MATVQEQLVYVYKISQLFCLGLPIETNFSHQHTITYITKAKKEPTTRSTGVFVDRKKTEM